MPEDQNLSLRELLRWLRGITRPVHPPLMFSAFCRVMALSLDLGLFAAAAATAVHLVTSDASAAPLFVLLVVLAVGKATFFYLEQFSGHYVAFKALELLRTFVFSQLWPKAPAIVTHTRSGDVLASLTRDVDRIEVVYAHTFAPVVSAFIVGPIAVVAAGLWAGWSTIAIAAVSLVVSLFIVPFIGLRRAWADTANVLVKRRDLSHHVSDSVLGADEVLGYGRETERLAETDELGVEIFRLSAPPRDITGVRRGANVTLSLVAAVSVVWMGSRAGHSPVVLAVLAAFTLRLFEGPRGVEAAVGYLDHSLAAARRLWEIAHAPEAVVDGPKVLSLIQAPEVRFSEVSYAYPTRDGASADSSISSPNALTEASFVVPAGGRAVLVGHSGSGKSTLVQLLLRYDDPQAGSITINGEPIQQFTLNSLRRNIVVVSQKNQLLNSSIAENLRLGTPNASDEELWAALQAAHLEDEVRAMPEGLATAVGQDGSALSGGQAQRLCLARALLMKPRVLVLDEFTANLNLELANAIQAELANHSADMTVMEITHRLDSMPDADVLVVVDDGKIVASGEPEQVLPAILPELV